MNVTAMVNTSGTVVERYGYDAYGKASIFDGSWSSRQSSSYDNEVLYCGYRYCAETGIYDVRYRFYHPRLGRWFIPDHIMHYADGLNLYEYVMGKVVDATDPLGLTLVIPTFDDGPVGKEWQEPGKCPETQDQLLHALHKILAELRRRGVRAVFYVAFVSCDTSCKSGPKATDAGMKKAFQAGIDAITKDGHIIALHAYDQTLWEELIVDEDKLKEDIRKLMDLLQNVPYKNLWRAPKGGMATLAVPELIADEMGLTYQEWDIDSEDYTYHHDAGCITNALYGKEQDWLKNVLDTLDWDIFWAGGSGAKWVDILFHVNNRTANNISKILDGVEKSYKNTYGKDKWGPGKEFYWLTQKTLNTSAFQHYVTGKED